MIKSGAAAQFRNAVASGEFARASSLWAAYAAGVELEIRRGSGNRLKEMRELIEWTRRVVICSNAHSLHTLRTRIAKAHAACAYRRTGR
jgi:hypothetical protein